MLKYFVVVGIVVTSNCPWRRIDDCTDHIEGAVYYDEVFDENDSVVIKNQAVIIRTNVTAKKIRVDYCGYLTVADSVDDIAVRAMHIDVVDGGELQVRKKSAN